MAASLYYSSLALNQANSSGIPVPCTVTEVRSQPLLKKCSDYRLSIVRMSIPGRALPVYELGPQLGQADPTKMGYYVQVIANVKGAAPPVFPWTPALAVNFTANLALGRARLETAALALPSAAYADPTAVAAALTAAFAGSGFTFLSSVTVAADALGRLIVTPPAGSTIQIVPTLPIDSLALGFTAAQAANTTVGAITAQNSCNLVNPQTYTATAVRQIIWIPENQDVAVAAPPLAYADFSGTYYWGYSLSHAASLWNTAYKQAQADAQAAILLQWPQFQGFSSKPLFITYDPATQLFTATADAWSSASSSGPAQSTGALYPVPEEVFTLSMDEPSDALFGAWNEVSPPGSIGTPAYATLVFDAAPLNPAGTSVLLVQDASTLSSGWSPCTSIIVTSNDISCISECISAPALYGNVPFAGQTASTFAPIVSEISFLGGPCTVWTDENIYEPFVLRSVQLTSDQPLTTVSFALSWRDRFGVVRPVYLPAAGGTFTLKAQFIRNGAREDE